MNSIRVSILGQPYPLKVEEGDEEMMHEIARFVDKRFQDFKAALTNQREQTVMVLAALSIAEELYLEKSENKKANNAESQEVAYKEASGRIRKVLDELKRKNSDIL